MEGNWSRRAPAATQPRFTNICRALPSIRIETPNTFYFYESYKDDDALAAHRAAPHYAVWRAFADAPGNLEAPAEITRTDTVFPSDRAYWGKV